MATIVLSAAGMAIGGSIGGSVLGLSSAIIGRAAGATLGRMIDNRILGAGSDPVETGRVDRFRLTGASEGSAVAQVYGRMRVGGQVIWATEFLEDSTSSGGKGASSQPRTTEYSYSVSLALALCEGPIARVGRIWADGEEIAPDLLAMSVYKGSEDQQPDPRIEAVEGAGAVPAYRGIAYVVIEDLDLSRFGNRVPQLNFEVLRPAATDAAPEYNDMAQVVRAVALLPGSGEYTLATTPVTLSYRFGEQQAVNTNTPSGKTDLVTSLDALRDELPNCGSVSLVVSWFGDDLRCGQCQIRPKVEQTETDAQAMPWRAGGLTRSQAQVVPSLDGATVYGGTPADASVMQAIAAIRARGQEVVFYPFILMDQLSGNGRADPWTGAADQPALPWRGRITLSAAPGQPGSPDRSAGAEDEVAEFFGTAGPADFQISGTSVSYSGPQDWGYRRFILHNAALCAAAGGVDAFCIGSEMRGLTQIRGAADSFPAVEALRALAADVRAILGPDCVLGYAADWSEYHGYQPDGTGDKHFHLDPLWADPEIDFIGIDNYLPLSDWREDEGHADAHWGAIHALDYLRGNIAGGEGYDWYYHSPEARDAQIRTPITDGDGEDWVWRVKDLIGWWSNPHHDRIDGSRVPAASSWVPQSKPIWFTELGCAAIDKGTNQPNRFLDPKSSESGLPHYSDGQRDDLIQMQYLRAHAAHWAEPANNPVSAVYGAPMVDMSRAHVWAWDARPYPHFPGNQALWSDGANYTAGHWITGRDTARTLASVVAEICARSGLSSIDTSRLFGIVRGYSLAEVGDARAMLQPLMLAYSFDAFERDGRLTFVSRSTLGSVVFDPGSLAVADEEDGILTVTRDPAAEISGRVRLSFFDADADYQAQTVEAIHPDTATVGVSSSELSLALSRGEARGLAERWLAESRVARETARFALPPSARGIGVGDIVSLPDSVARGLWRIDRAEEDGLRLIEAVRVEPEVWRARRTTDDETSLRPYQSPVPVEAMFLDLPLLTGAEDPQAPHLAVAALPWPGSIALYSAPQDSNYALDRLMPRSAIMGLTETSLALGGTGLLHRGPALRVRLVSGALSSVSEADMLGGANVAAIGDGGTDNWEVIQFAEAELVASQTYDLRGLLRGQGGTDGIAPPDWPQGSVFVLLDAAVSQIGLTPSQVNTTRFYRYGPASRPMDDASYRAAELSFHGNGLRPYPVCHLRAAQDGDGGYVLGWTRRTRIGGDDWAAEEVPLGEAGEVYALRVVVDGAIVRSATAASPSWTYTAAQIAADGAAGGFRVDVAQVSDIFGAGPYQRLVIG